MDKINELARKYRPTELNEYMGTEIVNRVRARFKEDGSIAHGILIAGSYGCGKTTIGRLIAKELQCLNKGEDGESCGTCAMCNMIKSTCIGKGEDVSGVQVLDIATESGKASMEAILNEASYPPLPPIKYKVVILDEVHMATDAAQNCLLNKLEEPPSHLIFILCTTKPEGLLNTIKSRCGMQLCITPPDIKDLVARMSYIAKSEHYNVQEEALTLIAKHTKCIPRDALNLLEDIALSNHRSISVNYVLNRLHQVSTALYIEFFIAAETSLSQLVLFLAKLKKENISAEQFIGGLCQFMIDALFLKNGTNIEDYSETYAIEIGKIFKNYSDEKTIYVSQLIEYAVLNAKSCRVDALLDVILINLGTRIHQADLLSQDLKLEKQKVESENDAAYRQYMLARKEEAKANKPQVKTTKVNDDLLASIFGKNLTTIKPEIQLTPPTELSNGNGTEEEQQARAAYLQKIKAITGNI